MFAFAHDHERHALVSRMIPPTSDEDYETAIEKYGVLAKEANAADAAATLIVIVEEGTATPNAAWRKRIAESNARFQKMRFSLVTSDAVTRTILALINWLTPKRAGFVRTSHATFEEAVAWCEEQTGKPMGYLRDLERQTRKATSRAAG